jgi:hypothetical protein
LSFAKKESLSARIKKSTGKGKKTSGAYGSRKCERDIGKLDACCALALAKKAGLLLLLLLLLALMSYGF